MIDPSIGAKPIEGENPAGDSPDGCPEWPDYDAEFSKIGGLNQAELNWGRLATIAATIVEKRSKDLKVASTLAIAAFNAFGLAGAKAGVQVVSDVCKTYWETMPTRPKARQNALQNLTDKLYPAISESNFEAADQPVLAELKVLFDNLETDLTPKLEGKGVGMFKMAKLCEEKINMLAGAEGGAEGGDGAAAPAAGGAPAARAGGGGGGPLQSRADAYKRLKELADFLKKTEPQNPVTFLVHRAAKWSDMRLDDIMQELIGKEQNAKRIMWEHLGLEEHKPN
ncbi:MAG: ImpA family type VI secretion system protein [Planctomycetota bacterium]